MSSDKIKSLALSCLLAVSCAQGYAAHKNDRHPNLSERAAFKFYEISYPESEFLGIEGAPLGYAHPHAFNESRRLEGDAPQAQTVFFGLGHISNVHGGDFAAGQVVRFWVENSPDSYVKDSFPSDDIYSHQTFIAGDINLYAQNVGLERSSWANEVFKSVSGAFKTTVSDAKNGQPLPGILVTLFFGSALIAIARKIFSKGK